MWPHPQFHANLVKFTEEILNGKLHFLCNGVSSTFVLVLNKPSLYTRCFSENGTEKKYFFYIKIRIDGTKSSLATILGAFHKVGVKGDTCFILRSELMTLEVLYEAPHCTCLSH